MLRSSDSGAIRKENGQRDQQDNEEPGSVSQSAGLIACNRHLGERIVAYFGEGFHKRPVRGVELPVDKVERRREIACGDSGDRCSSGGGERISSGGNEVFDRLVAQLLTQLIRSLDQLSDRFLGTLDTCCQVR